ncbi:translation initiation factor IF-2 [Candidatus Peribacteria bacterium]|jgi:translation initiation factor IF-2|nr:translation initiation factor IF-2 [Candidatus Peribacteria bacterium]MBT4021305.1 translation initiation factor IF-2 [Candidatus Peribacteria bacterium]MBT4241234.1 translation initiation factor IF-2 [Candidatus Peribacteria bacterium]MBT4474259.1 translation initiation factor IF-2 [Candidatus Peribacteria bacterium]
MRLVEVAKKLGITGQELRRELSQVDFGVKPTDREVPDGLAQGILRFVARKRGIEIKEDDELEETVEDSVVETKAVDAAPSETEEQTDDEDSSNKRVHVLRKLTLDDVSAEAVERQKAVTPQSSRKPKAKTARLPERQSDKKKGADKQEQIKKKEGVVCLPEVITVKEFAEKTGVQIPKAISVLMKNGVMANMNQDIDFDSAAIVAAELGVDVKKEEAKVSAENLLAGNLEQLLKEDDDSVMTHRPPVITVMGHVDHGKTAILDAIRETDVVSEEAGGITQAIGAHQVEHDGKKITFLDTPGHEAFTSMRARGAQITDIVILVVSADEGIKPTTVEAINHAKDANVPIIVAINKIDTDRADPDRVKGELAQHDLQPEDWGGKTPTVLCSAKTGQGINDLLDSALILSEISELKSNQDRNAVATVIESNLDPSLGPVGSFVVNAGTLKVGDIFVCGVTSGKVKSMIDSHGNRLDEVGPSGAVQIAGLNDVPETGDILQVVDKESDARKLLVEMIEAREAQKKRGIGDLISRISEGKLAVLKAVLKADSLGSLEAIEASLAKMKTESGISTKLIHSSVGSISESDVMIAAASDGIVLGFNVSYSSHVEKIAQENGVQIRTYGVIYELLDEVEGLLEGMVEEEETETVTGHLEVKGVFFRKKSEQVVGGKVTDGYLKRVPFRLKRDDKEIGTGRITSLKRVEKDIKEAKEGSECGMRIDCNLQIEEGDVIEGYVKELKKKS